MQPALLTNSLKEEMEEERRVGNAINVDIEKKKQFLVQKPSLILHITYFVHPWRELYTSRGSIHWKDTFASHFSFALSLVSKLSFAIGT